MLEVKTNIDHSIPDSKKKELSADVAALAKEALPPSWSYGEPTSEGTAIKNEAGNVIFRSINLGEVRAFLLGIQHIRQCICECRT